MNDKNKIEKGGSWISFNFMLRFIKIFHHSHITEDGDDEGEWEEEEEEEEWGDEEGGEEWGEDEKEEKWGEDEEWDWKEELKNEN